MDHKKAPILIVDDERSIRESFKLILAEKYDISLAASGETALKKIAEQKVDLIFLDIRMPGMDGLETLKNIKKNSSHTQVVMVTAVNDVEKASQAIALGATEYIVKPFEVAQILSLTEKLLQKKYLTEEAKAAFEDSLHVPYGIIGTSAKTKKIIEKIEKIADKDFFVLLEGAIGTEKEDIARNIHRQSLRRQKNFRTLCVPKDPSINQLEKDLFGSGGGTTIQSLELFDGLLENTSNGTLLVKNIENLPKPVQEKLSQAIRDKSFTREGSHSSISFLSRLICTSNVSLKNIANSDAFNLDLYSLISEVTIEIPLLSERNIDIPEIVGHYLLFFCQLYQKNIKGFTDEALNILSTYSWPGNTDELKAAIERIVLTKNKEMIDVFDLPLDILINSTSYLSMEDNRRLHYDKMSEEFEKEMIQEVLTRAGHDKSRAASILKIPPTAFGGKLEAFGI